jgi:hypothetical protein
MCRRVVSCKKEVLEERTTSIIRVEKSVNWEER